MPDESKKYKPQRTWLTFLILGVVITTSVFFLSVFVFGDKQETLSANSSVRRMVPAPESSVGGKGTDYYNGVLRDSNEKKSLAALDTGESYFPDVVGQDKGSAARKRSRDEEKPRTRTTYTDPTVQSKPRRDIEYDQLKTVYSNAVAAILNRDIDTSQLQVIDFTENEQSPKDRITSGTALQTEVPPINLKAGDQLYVSNIISINSDVPSPVHAEIVGGEYSGGKLFGSFQRHKKHLLLRFNQLVFNGITYSINAIAFDVNTMSAAVRSSVDSHYLERWGGIIAGSFLRGFARAVEESGTTTTQGYHATTTSHPEYDTNDQMWIAAGEVGSKLGETMERNFDMAPTVYLANGTDGMIGVLVLNAGKSL